MAYCVSSAATRRRPCRCRLTGAVRWKGWIRKRGIDSRVARSRVVVNRGGARRTAPGRHARRVLTRPVIHGALRDRPHNFIKPFITPNSGVEGTDSCAMNSKLRGCDSKRNHRCTTSPTPRGAARCGLCRGCLPSSPRSFPAACDASQLCSVQHARPRDNVQQCQGNVRAAVAARCADPAADGAHFP